MRSTLHRGTAERGEVEVEYEVVWFDAPAKYMGMNDRYHWAAKAKLNEQWRDAAYWAIVETMSTSATARRRPPATVTINLPFGSNRDRDPHNYAPTMKAIIDGMVLAGCWNDDTPTWIKTLEPVLTVDPARCNKSLPTDVGSRVAVRLTYDRGPRPD